ncbi:hypothetical protein Acr_08g0012710 [Actinidia rufa]|uniref:Uncharacterized protein n=1 Tax=Actinidia rufa TaxID=165716 RepID=A0A7J0F2E7_9ERIC|nr:hypothetical protein Acr_08g0012710 [Actinidia rufa]
MWEEASSVIEGRGNGNGCWGEGEEVMAGREKGSTAVTERGGGWWGRGERVTSMAKEGWKNEW